MIEPFLLAVYPPQTIGALAVAGSAAGFTALAFAVMAFALGRTFGRISDALVALAALLNVGLAMVLLPEHRVGEPQLALIAFSLALLGGFVAAFGSILAATGAASWFLAQLYVAAGNALLGIWLVMLNVWAGGADAFPNGVVTIGVFAGSVMALGMGAIPGILVGADSEQSAPWISRYVGRAGNLGWLILAPLWCAWLGRSLLRS